MTGRKKIEAWSACLTGGLGPFRGLEAPLCAPSKLPSSKVQSQLRRVNINCAALPLTVPCYN